MAVTLLEGSPFSDGHRIGCIADIDGPTSYSTGGQEISADKVCMTFIESANAGASNDGVHLVHVAPGGKGPKKTVKLIWIVLATGLEAAAAANLSTKSVRVQFRGE